MSISGIGSYNSSSISGRNWSKSSPADMLADVQKLTTNDDGSAGPAKQYDFTSMTPKEMKGLADQLFAEGKIDLTQNFMLQRMGIPLGKLGTNGEFISLQVDELTEFENKAINYFDVARGTMDFLKQSGKSKDPQFGYQNWEHIVSVLDELQGTPKGIDLTA